MTIKSKALEVNIADYHVDVTIDPKYGALHAALSQYFGIREGVATFLEELSHPYKNWQFIVNEARTYSLDYFHLVRRHDRGVEAALTFVAIFSEAIQADCGQATQMDAADNLLLFIQKIIRDCEEDLDRFLSVITSAFKQIHAYPPELFKLFVKSHYQIKQIGEIFLQRNQTIDKDSTGLNQLVARYFQATYDYWLGEKDPQPWFESELDESESQQDWSEFFDDISHASIRRWQRRLNQIVFDKDLSAHEQTAQLGCHTTADVLHLQLLQLHG